MHRRAFLEQCVIAGAVAAAGTTASRAMAATADRGFHLQYAPHFGMFRHHAGENLIDQVKFMADEGFTALEDNGMAGRPVEMQEKIAREMQRLDMEMGVFVASASFREASLTSGDQDHREQAVAGMRKAVEVAKRVNAKWCTVVPGLVDHRQEMDYQTANVIETLKRCAEVCEPSGLVMVLEPLNHWTDHPELFLNKIPQAYLICRAVDSPSCKILFDIYHQQISEGNLIPNMERAWDEVAYFQVGDNPGRKEPTTGEINYRNVFQYIHGKGFQGVVGMEHGNSLPGKEGERAVIDAYKTCDDF